MRKNILLLILLYTYVSFSSYTTKLSFDRPLPMTWYEKGFDATMGVWHAMNSFFDEALHHKAEESLDIMLGKCAFACFCLEKMRYHKQYIIDEDMTYFSSLVCHLEEELSLYALSREYEDQIMCLRYMINNMKNCLKAPCRVDTK